MPTQDRTDGMGAAGLGERHIRLELGAPPGAIIGFVPLAMSRIAPSLAKRASWAAMGLAVILTITAFRLPHDPDRHPSHPGEALTAASPGQAARYFRPTAMEYGPCRCSTRTSRNPASRIQAWHSAPV